MPIQPINTHIAPDKRTITVKTTEVTNLNFKLSRLFDALGIPPGAAIEIVINPGHPTQQRTHEISRDSDINAIWSVRAETTTPPAADERYADLEGSHETSTAKATDYLDLEPEQFEAPAVPRR